MATTQIVTVMKELKEMQATAAMFLQQFEKTECECSKLYDELQEHQKATILERCRENTTRIREL